LDALGKKSCALKRRLFRGRGSRLRPGPQERKGESAIGGRGEKKGRPRAKNFGGRRGQGLVSICAGSGKTAGNVSRQNLEGEGEKIE